jgi:Protein of unknown function (DUF3306)
MNRPDGDDPAGEGFLGRWARRKQDAAREAPKSADVTPDTAQLDAAASAGAPQVASAPAIADGSEPAAVEQRPLPSLDDIIPGADVTAFLQPHVPDALRTAALRKLWVTDPTIKTFIEMADYQWDFTKPDSIPGWSSTLDGVDVQAMVEKIFNAVKPQDAPEAATEGDPEPEPSRSSTAAAPSAVLQENTDTAMIPDASGDAATKGEGAASNNCAVQNSPSESSVYEPLRRRHGGALPT